MEINYTSNTRRFTRKLIVLCIKKFEFLFVKYEGCAAFGRCWKLDEKAKTRNVNKMTMGASSRTRNPFDARSTINFFYFHQCSRIHVQLRNSRKGRVFAFKTFHFDPYVSPR